MRATTALPPRAGLGLKAAHLREALASDGTAVAYFEVHAENCMVDGGPWPAALERIGERHALSLHGVGLSLGGLRRPDRSHLRRLARVIARHRPRAYSEHLAWCGHAGVYHADLLPLRWDEPTLARVAAHVDETQQALGLRLLVENPATYLGFDGASLGEARFIAELVARTGCALLLDVCNAHVSAVNQGRDALAYLQALPLHAVGEIHLAGFAEDRDAAGAPLLIDSHGAPVDDAVWQLYEWVIARTGPRPTLIERDRDVPPWPVLVAEAARADQILARASDAAQEQA